MTRANRCGNTSRNGGRGGGTGVTMVETPQDTTIGNTVFRRLGRPPRDPES